ncbi:hypothetical protein L1987_02501 [Smallanthus sonchifolius]|uniref:Uncharacterized protein n=1 Tax=Smallanthus sonchifolius TaxID=185202 RepID=A0ACB9K863_9ASTR|nr:hypothetical protein L1987_02501 [Smallanthus sonchifolius]
MGKTTLPGEGVKEEERVDCCREKTDDDVLPPLSLATNRHTATTGLLRSKFIFITRSGLCNRLRRRSSSSFRDLGFLCGSFRSPSIVKNLHHSLWYGIGDGWPLTVIRERLRRLNKWWRRLLLTGENSGDGKATLNKRFSGAFNGGSGFPAHLAAA